MKTGFQTLTRRFDLDWLRVIAILLVFVFHSTRFFDPMDWHVKNPSTFSSLQLPDAFFILWGMPLIFVVSGASVYFAAKSTPIRFIYDKVRRLLIPLVAGILFQIPISVYLERITHRQFAGTLLDFLPHYFDGVYPYGNFAWQGLHLWYLLVLFVYSMLFLPLLVWVKDGMGRSLLSRIGNFLALPGLVYLLALPAALLQAFLDPRSELGRPSFGGWSPLPYIGFFLAGLVVISHACVQKRIVQYRWLTLLVSIVLTAGMMRYWTTSPTPVYGTNTYTIFNLVYGFIAWAWIQVALGFTFKHLNAPHPYLSRISEAVLPFYILHQTVLLVLGYFIVQWQIPDGLKWMIIAASSFVVILVLYEFLVRRSNILRFLFGLKPLPQAEQRARSVEPAPSL